MGSPGERGGSEGGEWSERNERSEGSSVGSQDHYLVARLHRVSILSGLPYLVLGRIRPVITPAFLQGFIRGDRITFRIVSKCGSCCGGASKTFLGFL